MDCDLIERFVAPRRPSRESEDLIFMSCGYVAVIDGAGMPRTSPLHDRSPGLFVARQLMLALAESREDADAMTVVPFLTDWVASSVRREFGEIPRAEPRPAASIVMYNIARREVWRVGSGTLRYDRVSYRSTNPVERLRSEWRAAFLSAVARLGGLNLPPERPPPAPDPLLEVQHAFQNCADDEWGFGVIDGTRVPDRFIERVPIQHNVREIILASDGYPEVGDSLEDTEGLLQRSLASDPLRVGQFRETKGVEPGAHSFDDRSYIRLAI